MGDAFLDLLKSVHDTGQTLYQKIFVLSCPTKQYLPGGEVGLTCGYGELVKGDADLLLERERSLPNAGKGHQAGRIYCCRMAVQYNRMKWSLVDGPWTGGLYCSA